MSQPNLTTDDPRLTAFVLAELEPAECDEIQAAIDASPELQAAVAEIRETVGLLIGGFAGEPVEELTREQRQLIEATAEIEESPDDVAALQSVPSEKSRRVAALVCTVALVVCVAVLLTPQKLFNSRFDDPLDSQVADVSGNFAGSADPLNGINFMQERFAEELEVDAEVAETQNTMVGDAVASASGGLGSPTELSSSDWTSTGNVSKKYESQIDLVRKKLDRATKTSFIDPKTGSNSNGVIRSSESVRLHVTPSIVVSQPEKPLQASSGNVSGAYNPDTRRAVLVGRDLGIEEPGKTSEKNWVFEEYRQRSRDVTLGTEAYATIVENPYLSPLKDPLSTFGFDVDTASYTNIRRFLNNGQFPPPQAVRIEELVNYFNYGDSVPKNHHPLAVHTEVGDCPWRPNHRLVRIGVKAKEIAVEQRPPSNLVFLVDVSGSMRDENKLPLVKSALELLVDQMTEDDRIAIVTYASNANLLLESTSGEHREKLLSAVGGLQAGGSTNGEAGIHLAYNEAAEHFINNGTNRVILCTDGDFNVGTSSDNELVQLIQEKTQSNVFLSIFGFGTGNLKDAKLEQLADKGNGHYGYIDNLREAQKVFVEELTGTLYTVAKDVKLQVEFNPTNVGAYRLIGYENRALAAADFNNDKKDAGDLGAGHSVVALYEVIPPDKLPESDVDPLKYQKLPGAPLVRTRATPKGTPVDQELLTVKVRYKLPEATKSQRLNIPVMDRQNAGGFHSLDYDWSAAVAAFGMVLRNSEYRHDASFELVLELALGARGEDEQGRRREFIEMVQACRLIDAKAKGLPAPAAPALSETEAKQRAACDGKYSGLLKKIEVAGDVTRYGTFREYGHWVGRTYAGYGNLPTGYWVYMAPHWYIWEHAREDAPAGSEADAATSR